MNEQKLFQIAIDGPSGAGKSTIAKTVAQKLGIDYIDTGAMYRALGLKMLRLGIPMREDERLAAMLADTDIDFSGGHVYLDGEDVSDRIRTQEISKAASDCSVLALDSANPGALKEGNRELRDKLEMKIQLLRGAGKRVHYESIKLHRTEISDYRKRDGRCIITFQTAVQYYHTLQREDGTILEGSRDRLCQTKYNTDVIYIQDRNLIEEERDFSLGINCPNCGAPISGLGSKVCAYCGTPIVELNIYAWSFSNVTEV